MSFITRTAMPKIKLISLKQTQNYQTLEFCILNHPVHKRQRYKKKLNFNEKNTLVKTVYGY